MAITAHAPDLPVQQPLTDHPVVTEPPLEAELLLAQAVVQLGTADWNRVAQLLDQSECWPKEAGRMTSQVRAQTGMPERAGLMLRLFRFCRGMRRLSKC
jgi:hypothetical protein